MQTVCFLQCSLIIRTALNNSSLVAISQPPPAHWTIFNSHADTPTCKTPMGKQTIIKITNHQIRLFAGNDLNFNLIIWIKFLNDAGVSSFKTMRTLSHSLYFLPLFLSTLFDAELLLQDVDGHKLFHRYKSIPHKKE